MVQNQGLHTRVHNGTNDSPLHLKSQMILLNAVLYTDKLGNLEIRIKANY